MTIACIACVGVWMASAPAVAGDYDCKGCAKIKSAGEGFCAHCKSGKIFGLKVSSQKLFDSLAGSSAYMEKVKSSKCSGCKDAAKTNGACEHCNVYVASGKVYKNRFAHALARGTLVDHSATKKCPGCVKAAKSGGFCSGCDVGVVADRTFKTRGLYDSAVKAFETVKAAIKDAAHCEACSTARISDGKCEHCKVAFKDGKAI